MTEKNRVAILELMKTPGNNTCADCGAPSKNLNWPESFWKPYGNLMRVLRCVFDFFLHYFLHGFELKWIDPEWTSATMGLFICIRCSGIHRNLTPQVSSVKSLKLDAWTDEKLEVINPFRAFKRIAMVLSRVSNIVTEICSLIDTCYYLNMASVVVFSSCLYRYFACLSIKLMAVNTIYIVLI